MSRWPAILAACLAPIILTAGCGEDEGGDTRLEGAISEVGNGISPTGTGFGWLELAGKSGSSAPIDNALGPGADDLVQEAMQIRRATGFDPAAAESAASLSGSYALGVLFRDADPGRLPELLTRAGATSRKSGKWTLFDLGEPADGQTRGPLVRFGALISRIAIGPEGVVFTRFEGARTALTADRGTLADESPGLNAAAGCLGEVVAARMQLGTHTYNRRASPDLTAVGQLEDGREVVCAIDESDEYAELRQERLERAFSPEGIDELTGKRISAEVAGAEVSRETDGELNVTRAEIEPAAGAEPGFLFNALVRGSLLTYLGVPRPVDR